MDLFAFVDSETSGLFDFSKPADAEGQPRLASLALLLCSAEGRTLHSYTRLVRPDGWEVDEDSDAFYKNRLSQALLERFGVPVAEVLGEWNRWVDLGPTFVAHNFAFDSKVMRGELRRAGLPDRYEETKRYCTMMEARKRYGFPKFPSLADSFEKAIGAPIEEAHDAHHDMLNCRRLFMAMRPAAEA